MRIGDVPSGGLFLTLHTDGAGEVKTPRVGADGGIKVKLHYPDGRVVHKALHPDVQVHPYSAIAAA